MAELSQFLVRPETTIRSVMGLLDVTGKGIALVVDESSRLIATITDGDLRRAVLAGINLDVPAQTLLDERQSAGETVRPVTALFGTPTAELLHVMSELGLRHVPLVDADARVVDVALLSELLVEYELPIIAVVMAGGYGTRLKPLTDSVPKPMLPIGDRPLLELIVEQLRTAGIKRVRLATHHKRAVITDHFGDGSGFGVEIGYLEEDTPLGTAGALSLMDVSDEPLLVMNGDVLTRVDFAAMLHYHRDHRADMTVAVRQHEFTIPFGVVETTGIEVVRISEKPTVRHFVSAGMYLLNPNVQRLIRAGETLDMPDLIRRLVGENYRVVSFPVREYWLDIGQHSDYERAVSDAGAQKV